MGKLSGRPAAPFTKSSLLRNRGFSQTFGDAKIHRKFLENCSTLIPILEN